MSDSNMVILPRYHWYHPLILLEIDIAVKFIHLLALSIWSLHHSSWLIQAALLAKTTKHGLFTLLALALAHIVYTWFRSEFCHCTHSILLLDHFDNCSTISRSVLIASTCTIASASPAFCLPAS